jgi:hypothetical protein
MSDTLKVLLVVALFFALGGFAAWKTTTYLRRGVFFTRMGVQVSRRESPILFWIGVSTGSIASVTALFIGLWIVGQLWTHA